MKNLLFSIILLLMITSCASITSNKPQPSLTGTTWVLSDQVKGQSPTLNFEDGKISGNSGCNNYFGPVTIDSNTGSFSAGNIAGTKMMCDNMSVEGNFLKMLNAANKYKINGNTLELYKDGLLLMKLLNTKR